MNLRDIGLPRVRDERVGANRSDSLVILVIDCVMARRDRKGGMCCGK
jgi:hypothetical protein